MTLRTGDRAKETALAPGTGDVSLGGAVVGFTAFSAITGMGNGDIVYYAISDGGANWEVGLGTYASSGNKLQRTTILRSSNSNAAVNFTNPITVWSDAPAVKLPLLDVGGNLLIGTTLVVGDPANSKISLAGIFRTTFDSPAVPNGGATIKYQGLQSNAVYLVSTSVEAAGGVATCCGLVLTGDSNNIAATVSLAAPYYTGGVLQAHLQNINAEVDFAFDPPNSLGFQFVYANTSGFDTTATVNVVRIL